jgi:Kef-type K+ transport system membrane component KefB
MVPLAVGVPGWPAPSTAWDWWPFVGIALACYLVFWALRLRPGAVPILAVIAAGPLFATLVHGVGVVPACAGFVAAGMLLSRVRRGGRAAPPRV